MQWNLTNILIILAVFFFGYGIGLIEMHLRRQKKINELEAARKRELENAALATTPPPRAVSAPTPSDLRLWTDANGILRLDLDNQPVNTPAAATSEQRRRLVTLLTRLRPWVESTPAPPAAPEVQPRPAVAEVPPVKKEKPRVEGSEPVPVLKSIVEQIDDVLQAKLPGTPFKTRAIRLTEGPGGVVLVWEGLNKYEGIDAVPDPEIQALIRQAVAEWEKGSR